MHEAAKVGQVDILMLLLRNGGRVNHRDVTGVTPLAVAAEHGHYNVTEILLNCGQSADKTELNSSDFTKAIQETQSPTLVLPIKSESRCCFSPLVSAQAAESTLRPVMVKVSCWTRPHQETPPAFSCCWTTEPTQTCPAPPDTCPSTRQRTPDTTSELLLSRCWAVTSTRTPAVLSIQFSSFLKRFTNEVESE